jgi:hypothetical protein
MGSRYHKIEVEDTAALSIELQGGGQLSLFASSAGDLRPGTEHRLAFDHADVELSRRRYRVTPKGAGLWSRLAARASEHLSREPRRGSYADLLADFGALIEKRATESRCEVRRCLPAHSLIETFYAQRRSPEMEHGQTHAFDRLAIPARG